MSTGSRLGSLRSSLKTLGGGKLFWKEHVQGLASGAKKGDRKAVGELCGLILSKNDRLVSAAKQALSGLPEEGREACCDYLFLQKNERLRVLCRNNSYLPCSPERMALFQIISGECLSREYTGPVNLTNIARGFLKATWSERMRVVGILMESGRPDLLSGVLAEPGGISALPVHFISLMAKEAAARGDFHWLTSNFFSFPLPAAVTGGHLMKDSGYLPDDGDPGYWKGLAESLPERYEYPEFPGETSALLRGGNVRYQILEINQNGTLLAAGCYDGTIELWRIPGGGLLHSFYSRLGRIISLKFSPDGMYLACGGDRGRFLLIDVLATKIINDIETNVPSLYALDWMNSEVIVGGSDGFLGSIPLVSGKVTGFFSSPSTPEITCLTVGSDGLIYYGDRQGFVSVWDPSAKGSRIFTSSHKGPVLAICCSIDGTFLASASLAGGFLVHSRESGQLIEEVGGDMIHSFSTVVISPDASWCAGGDGSGNLRVYGLPDGRTITCRFLHGDGIGALAASPDGKMVIVGTAGGLLHILSVPDPDRIITVRTSVGGIHTMTATTNGMVAITGWQGVLEIRRLSDGSLLQRHEGRSGRISCASTLSSEGLVALSGRKGLVQILDPEQQIFCGSLDSYLPAVTAVALVGRGSYVLVGGRDGALLLLRLSDGEIIRSYSGHEGTIQAIAVHPDNNLIASGGWDTTIQLHEVREGGSDLLSGHASPVTGLSFLPSGRLLVSCSQDRTVRLWNLKKPYESAVLNGHTNVVSAVAVSPGGDMIASGSWDKTIRLWSVPDGGCFAILKRHDYRITSLLFCGRGLLVSCDEGGWLGFWLLPDGELIRFTDTREGHITAVLPGKAGRSVLTIHRKGVCISVPRPWVKVPRETDPRDLSSITEYVRLAGRSSLIPGDQWRFIECLVKGSLRSSIVIHPDPIVSGGYEIEIAEGL